MGENFLLITHRQNYLLPVTYNWSPNNQPFEDFRDNSGDPILDRVKRVETKFQLSFKFNVAENLFSEKDGIWVGYTHLAFWQVYNQTSSRPFRESNYEPELFYSNPVDLSLSENLKLKLWRVGLVHQSNGRASNLSRSWNRVFATTIFSYKRFGFGLTGWYRIPDSKDDNPGLTDYVGYWEFTGAYKTDWFTHTLRLRNSLEGRMRGFREYSMSFPLNGRVRGFFQYINGYGESLLDYTVSTNRVGLGLIISNFL